MITVAYHLLCDGFDGRCGAVFDTSLVPAGNGTKQRRWARERGWGRRGGKDLCPDCLALPNGNTR